MECIFRSIRNKKFIYAGFLYGPYCPIYGFAAIALILFLDPVKDNLLLFVILAALITTVDCGIIQIIALITKKELV